MKNYFFSTRGIFILLVFIQTLSSNAQSILWQKRYGGPFLESMYKTIPTKDGGFISIGTLYGNTAEGFGRGDIVLMKIDADFNLQWQKVYGGDKEDGGGTVIEANSGYLIVGSSQSHISGNKTVASKGDMDYWVIRTDLDGGIVWQNVYGGDKTDSGRSVISFSEEQYLIAGTSNSNSSGDKTEDSRGRFDFWVIRIDDRGVLTWQKTFGGNHDEYFDLLARFDEESFLLAGTSYSKANGDKTSQHLGQGDIWAIRFDQSGTILWQNTYGNEFQNNVSRDLIRDRDQFYITGSSESNLCCAKQFDPVLYTISNSGEEKRRVSYFADKSEGVSSMVRTVDGGWLMSLSTLSGQGGHKTEKSRNGWDLWFIKLDQNMRVMWDKTFGGIQDENAGFIIPVSGNEFIVTMKCSSDISGDITEPRHGPAADMLLIKLKDLTIPDE